jgi:hypothetical protein
MIRLCALCHHCARGRVHNRTDNADEPGHSVIRAHAVPTRQSMLIILGLLLTAIILVSMLSGRVHANGHGAHLGRMSEQWLAEQRSVRPS